MRPTDLRTAAARHFLGLSTTGYLLDVAHTALDSGIYAHGLGEIITSRDPIFAEIGPFFDSALKELRLEVSNWEEAVNRVAEGYMVLIAEGVYAPLEVTRNVYRDYTALRFERHMRMFGLESLGPLGDLNSSSLHRQ